MDQSKRQKWYKECLHWAVEDWAKVILSDESNFQVVNHKGRIYVKRNIVNTIYKQDNKSVEAQ